LSGLERLGALSRIHGAKAGHAGINVLNASCLVLSDGLFQDASAEAAALVSLVGEVLMERLQSYDSIEVAPINKILTV